jgi:3-deoxy-D-manno-octulosonate 8-phosphate phosphatase KdsC-like HAD superfamily phosphatase
MKLSDFILITDCDGVLTDGNVYVSQNGKETRRYHTYDGAEATRYFFLSYFITAETNKCHKHRAKKVGASYIRTDDKALFVSKIKEAFPDKYVIFVGDSLTDQGALQIADYAFSPKNGEVIEYPNSATMRLREKIIVTPNGGTGVLLWVKNWIQKLKLNR